jgi:DNA-binding MurR/RpiR family transcriptional regulator
MEYEALVRLLVERADTLSRRNAQVARFCLNHPEEVAIHTIVRLAEVAGVPPATFTRLAQELGFEGFPAFQTVFRERVMGPGPSFTERLSDLSMPPAPAEMADADLEHPDRVFGIMTRAAIHSLVRIDQNLDRAVLGRFVADLAAAEAVHVVAARGAFGIGAYLFYGLAGIGVRTHLLDNQGSMRAEQALAIGPRDVLLAITFDTYTPETVETARSVAARGLPVLAITDNELSPIAGLARQVLYVKEARLGHFRSQVPALVLGQSLIVSVGRRLGRRN